MSRFAVRLLAAGAVALASACAAPSALRPPATTVAADAAARVDAWAAAAGGRDRLARIAAVHIVGRVDAGGMTGTIDVWQTARGERRHEEELGGVNGSLDVFDGAQAWHRDRNRKVRDLDAAEVADQAALAYLGADAALLPDRRAGRVVRDGDGVRLEPAGGRPLTVRFDPATHLPTTIARPDAEKTRTIAPSDWREVGGVRFPFTLREDDGDPRNTRVVHVDRVEVDAAPPPSAFARPSDAPPDFRFAAGGQTTVPIEMVRQLIFVRVAVNGSSPLGFILDTGAEVTVINRSRLDRLGLTAVGNLGEGAGGGDVDVSFVKGVSFAVGGVTITDQVVTAIPLDGLEGPLGHPIDGVLGYDFISRFVVEIDYARARLTLRDPAAFTGPGPGEAVPITLQGGVPNVTAGIDVPGRPALTGVFVVDTGCTCAVDFNAPFTRANRLIEAMPKILTPPRGATRGAGGVTDTVQGRIGGLMLGRLRLPAPIASFARDTTGATADPESAGLIGGVVWRRFVVTLDYGRKMMWLDKNAAFDEPATATGTGVLWGPAGSSGSIAVLGLVDGAPGAEAGLVVGDKLVSVDGRPAAAITLAELSATFTKVGQPHKVVVDRAGKPIAVTLTARDLL
jgi:hypothetical protein